MALSELLGQEGSRSELIHQDPLYFPEAEMGLTSGPATSYQKAPLQAPSEHTASPSPEQAI